MISNSTLNDIAVIGMACRFPGAADLRSFWDLLRSGREGITHFSEEELRSAGVPASVLADPDYVRAYGWLEGVDLFDASFFGYTPREARLMDPQQRLFLETCWLALEHAGYEPKSVPGPAGVFAGAGQNAYRLQHLLTNPDVIENGGALETTLGNDLDFLTTRVSYRLGLTGPSIDVQTACSTSLVAVHLAVQSLLTGECDVALAGGVSIVSPRKGGYRYVPEGTFSPDGHTRTFDARARGMVGGDGVGVLVLKRLEDAESDGDTIFAVIKGTAVNNDGGQRIGFTAPSAEGQARVIAEAQAVAGVDPADITFVELHGTATPLGDAVEFAALQKVFGSQSLPRNSIALGSVKTNIGHTNAAAGAAGLIKSILALWHHALPPSLHFDTPNPELDLAGSPFFVNTEFRSWEQEKGRRMLAGVSSFGMGGTNAHAVLEEGPAEPGARSRIFSSGTAFDRRRYWIEPGNSGGSAGIFDKNPDPAEWFYAPSWKRTPAPASIQDAPTGRWLVFAGQGPIAARLIESTAAVVVRPGARFSRMNGEFTLRPGSAEDFDRLVDALKSEGSIPEKIVHLWCADPLPEDPDEALALGFYSLLFLARSLSRAVPGGRFDLAVVTENMQDVTGFEPLHPLQAAVLGPVRVIPSEMEGVTSLCIDVEDAGDTELPGRIFSEMAAGTGMGSGACVAYRGGFRWEQMFPLQPVPAAAPQEIPLRMQGVYLITGATGGIGRTIARHLAEKYRGRLALVSRSAPEEDFIQSLESAGAEVLALQANAADSSEMKAVFQAVRERFGPVHGVVHAAGLPGGGAIAVKSPAAAAAVLEAKVQGTLVLDALLERESPDFVLLCSSLAAVLGGYGQVDYTAANAFLDAYAPAASRRGRRTISLAWDTWKEAGMAVDTPVPKELEAQRAASLANGLTNREGVEVFERALAAGLPQLMVSTIDFDRRLQARDLIASSEIGPGQDEYFLVERRDDLTPVQARVAAIWEQMFGISPIGLEDDFFQLGGHSLLATQILNKLHREFPQIEISMRDLFEHPTIAGVAVLIETQRQQAGPLRPTLRAADLSALSRTDRRERLLAYLDHALTDEPIDAQSAHLIWLLKRDFDLRVYPQELAGLEGPAGLIDFIEGLWEPAANAGPVELPTVTIQFDKSPNTQNLPAVFILSAPRSGSTLLRLMLNGHSDLFAPPELALLAFDSMAAWQENQRAMFAVDGLTQALEAAGMENGAGRVSQWVSEERPVYDVYRELQAAAAPRMLVDKTPGYSMNPGILARAEAWFKTPIYIHLIRHPLPVIDSFARNRMHVVLGKPQADPYSFGERVWRRWNRNIVDHLASVDRERQIQIRYEDLVRQPERTIREVCRVLQVPFQEALLHPYRQDRMLAGPGDPDILLHDHIDSDLADAWKDTDLPIELSGASKKMMAEFGYEMPEHGSPPEELDSLTDAEVDRLLQQLLEEDEDSE